MPTIALLPTLLNIEQPLQLLGDQSPLVTLNLVAVELLQTVDTGTADLAVQRVLLLELPTVHGLIGAFDLDGDGRLALLADGDLLVVALDGSASCEESVSIVITNF